MPQDPAGFHLLFLKVLDPTFDVQIDDLHDSDQMNGRDHCHDDRLHHHRDWDQHADLVWFS